MREGNGSGTNVYLTTRKERIQQLPENLKYFCFHNHKEQENKEYVLTERNLILLENEEKPEKEETFFLNPYNDKIRPHKKLSYKNDTEGYLALMSVIALLAVYMAMFSIYDVLVIYQDFIKMSIVIAGFVFLHFILNVTGNGNEDKKKASAVKNGIIFAGYVVICFGGGFTFLFDAITEVTEIFGMEVTITEHDYGFLKYVSDDLEWLITLRTTVALCNEKIEVYVARNLIRTHQHLDENEFVNVEAHTVEELKQMIFEGKIEDSKTVAAILAYDAKYNR